MRFCLMKKASSPAQHHLAIAAYLRLNEAFLNNSEVNIIARPPVQARLPFVMAKKS
ncbi:hypothetical protein Pvag_0344 [Pantoea vagans C9-1]|jgi:hypothetical protein|nr:hypothetical protein Pvag_0344 [Pantoea vagans C9-1]